MFPSFLLPLVQEKLGNGTGVSTKPFSVRPVGGGSINDCYRLENGETIFFCKINSASGFPRLFEKEKNGLETIRATGMIAVPGVLDYFEREGQQGLLLQWIEEGERTKSFWKNFGMQLAGMHQVPATRFGATEDNYMGSVVQPNNQESSWTHFFIRQRLEPLVVQMENKGLLSAEHRHGFNQVYDRLPEIFDAGQQPVLVHGDLWSGNFMCRNDGAPVLIDPAVYYGHPAVDLGMTTLFGGFDRAFYEAYHYHAPLPLDHETQWRVCNLYPLLIHLLLFGKSYLPQIERTLRSFS
jgi:protein-ribulosamine 3-kinase